MAGEIFISYRRVDERWARLLRTELESRGAIAWYDGDIGVGADWRAATSRALESSRVFVLLYSAAAAESEEIAKELAVATLQKKVIVPVRLENYPATGPFLYELASRNWIDLFEDREARLATLADSLAAMVQGAEYAKPLSFERPLRREPATRRMPWRLPHWAVWAAISIAAAVVTVGGGFALKATFMPHPVSDRIAFFGIDAPPGDSTIAAVGQAASGAITNAFAAAQRDVALPADASQVPAAQRTERARSLGAIYAISGSISRYGDDSAISMQIEDAPSHTLLWSDTVTAPANAPDRLVGHAVALLSDTINCIIGMRAGLRHDDMAIVTKLPGLCRDLRSGQHDPARWEELLRLVPNSASLKAAAAISIGLQVSSAPPSSAQALKAEAAALTKEALALDPNVEQAQMARVIDASNDGVHGVALEAIFQDGVRRAPRGPSISSWYGGWLCSVGRFTDALPYLRASVQGDPLSGAKAPMLAGDQAVLGQINDAETVFTRTNELSPGSYEWSQRIISAIFRGVGSPQAVLADPPQDVSSQSLACWKVIARAAKTTDPAVRKTGGASAAACAASGAIDAGTAVFVAAMLGQLDQAFALANNLPAGDGNDTNGRALFDPRLAAFHADPRFAPLTQRLGMFSYWKASGKHPDFCAEGQSPVCLGL